MGCRAGKVTSFVASLVDDDSTSIFPTVASCLTVNAVLIGFILLAVRGDRANLKAADDKGKAKNKETKKDQ